MVPRGGCVVLPWPSFRAHALVEHVALPIAPGFGHDCRVSRLRAAGIEAFGGGVTVLELPEPPPLEADEVLEFTAVIGEGVDGFVAGGEGGFAPTDFFVALGGDELGFAGGEVALSALTLSFFHGPGALPHAPGDCCAFGANRRRETALSLGRIFNRILLKILL